MGCSTRNSAFMIENIIFKAKISLTTFQGVQVVRVDTDTIVWLFIDYTR